MTAHHSADARTALMAIYTARHANPRAGKRATAQSRGEEGGGRFGARGRTIYNAGSGALRELARIDAEEGQRKQEQFLMAARGDFEERRATTPSAAEMATADEMFALYIENI